MQVFKVYFKIIKKNIPMMMIYIFVFMGVSLIFTISNQTSDLIEFTETKCKVAFINNDTDSELVRGLVDYIGERSIPVTVRDDKESMQDALFFRKVEYIIRIPEGFTGSFLSSGNAVLEKTSIPDSTSAIYVDMMLENYLNSARLYIKHQPDITQKELTLNISKDLSEETPVVMKNYSIKDDLRNISYFFNNAFYSISTILIYGITSVMLVYNTAIMKQRTLCSPVSQRRISMETLLANSLFTITIWLIAMLISLIYCGKAIFSLSGLLWAVNLFLISIVGCCIAFLVGNLIKSKNVQSAVSNTLGLGMSFLSGAFVPQFLLGSAVLSVAKFLPSYWYVKASDQIGSLKEFSWSSLEPIMICLLIQLGFAAALICVSLVISRQKKQNSLA